jgi:hypothetical protein
MESFFGTLKSELIYLCAYRTRNEAKTSVFFYIEAFYNLTFPRKSGHEDKQSSCILQSEE